MPGFGGRSVPRASAAAPPEGTVRLGAPRVWTRRPGRVHDGRYGTVGVPTTGARVAARLPPGPDTPAHRTVTTYHHVAPRRPLGQPVRPVGTRPPRAGHPRPQPGTDTGAGPEAAPGRRGEPPPP
ncbi:hypothetical protein GPN2_20276 [Streptomyces murinus]